MKRIALALSLSLMATSVLADQLLPVVQGTNKNGTTISSYVDKDSIHKRPDGNVQYLLLSHFSKPQQEPKGKTSFSWVVDAMVARCQDKTSVNPMEALLNEQQKLVARYQTGENKLIPAAGPAKVMRETSIDVACKNSANAPMASNAPAAPAKKK